jgi:hypothetical protein
MVIWQLDSRAGGGFKLNYRIDYRFSGQTLVVISLGDVKFIIQSDFAFVGSDSLLRFLNLPDDFPMS